jgi:hypothetical protein
VLVERLSSDAEQLQLRVVAVRDERAVEVVGRAGDVREERADQPAGTGLRESDRGIGFSEALPDALFNRVGCIVCHWRSLS